MNDQSWGDFATAASELAAKGKERLHGRVCYLATVRADGSPRVHPVTPIVAVEALYVFMEPSSPKGHDLRRDARYALHVGVEDNNGGAGEFVVRGTARSVAGTAERASAAAASTYAPAERYVLFAFEIEEAVWTRYAPGAVRETWRA